MPYTLHLGPLRSESLALLQAQEPESLLLITPDEPTHQTMALINTLPHSEARMGLISTESASVTWHRYNLPEFNSQSPATGLKELYPGLQLQLTESRDTESLQSLVDELKAGDGLPKRLILEQPEQGLSVLQALHEVGALVQLEQLDIRSASQPLYEAMAAQAQLIEWCEQQAGLELQGQQADDPELPLLHFKRNPLFPQLHEAWHKLQELTEQLKVEKRKTSRLTNEHDALAAENGALKQQQDEQAKAIEAAQSECAKLKKERDSLSQERDTLKQQHNEQAKATEAAQSECVKLKKERNSLSQERDSLKQQYDEQAKAIEAAQAESVKLKKERNSLGQERDSLKQQHDEQAKAIEVAQSECAKLKEKAQRIETLEQESKQLKAQSQIRFEQLSEHKSHVARLETENQQLRKRQDLMQEELVKAEAQIELIKDLALREPSL